MSRPVTLFIHRIPRLSLDDLLAGLNDTTATVFLEGFGRYAVGMLTPPGEPESPRPRTRLQKVAAALQKMVAMLPTGSGEEGEAGPVAFTLNTVRAADHSAADLQNRIVRETSDSLRDIYRAHIFDGGRDMIWERDPASETEGSVLMRSESCVCKTIPGERPAGGDLACCCEQKCCEHDDEDNQYLLWGAVASAAGSWVTLHNGRVGNISVPLGAIPESVEGCAVRLRTREYFGPAPGPAGEVHGNQRLLAERFLGLEACRL